MAKIAILFVVLLVGAYVSLYTYSCRDEMPSFPIPPDARELSTVVSLDTTEGKLVRFDYQTSANLEAVQEFYDELVQCRVPSLDVNRLICTGDAEYGTYTVFIDGQSNNKFSVEVRWRTGCTLELHD